MTALYVYGVGRAEDLGGLSALGLRSSKLSLVCEDGLAAIVSLAGSDEILATRRNMLVHTKVLEEAMAFGPLVPFRFGSVVPSDGELRVLLSHQAEAFREQHTSLKERYEIGIRITLNQSAVMKAAVAENPSLRAEYEYLQAQPENVAHYRKVDLGRAVQEAVATFRDTLEVEIQRTLEPLLQTWKSIDRQDDFEVLHFAALVNQSGEEQIMEALTTIDARHPELLLIKVVSPVPPYNFVELTLDVAGQRAA